MKWIAVEERLPTEHDFYLCLLESKDIVQAEYHEGVWFLSLGAQTDKEITHWMQIPNETA